MFIAIFALACAAFVVLVMLGIKAVRYAKGGSAGAHVLGAFLILMGFGNMQDPTMEMVARAKEQRRSDEDDSGDPPGPQGEDDEPG